LILSLGERRKAILGGCREGKGKAYDLHFFTITGGGFPASREMPGGKEKKKLGEKHILLVATHGREGETRKLSAVKERGEEAKFSSVEEGECDHGAWKGGASSFSLLQFLGERREENICNLWGR